MSQISEHTKHSNHNIHYYDNMVIIIVNLINKKCKKHNNSTGHFNNIQRFLLMSIVDTPENDVSNVDRRLDKKKKRTSSIKSSSTLFPCSIRAMYNRFHCAQNKHLTLK